ncbi:fibronectin type III domain-containing protein [Marinobacter fonticola]|uniref:fibronectin type III domain-containing protein n=1 Tax=Marinobacter fonticola TaxID=2603215 RepID=UPI0011E878D7|nr:fibronectin type III domain-containing protein [Marinobacter fonticola]
MGDIEGYRIYYKLRDQRRYSTITVHSASDTSFSLSGFRPGTYEFSISTVDTEGLESRPSRALTVSIN